MRLATRVPPCRACWLLLVALLSGGCASEREAFQGGCGSKEVGELLSAGRNKEAAASLRGQADKLRDRGAGGARRLYEEAVAAADDPDNHFAYAEYLRQYRGPGLPLFPEAAGEYFAALRLLDAAEASGAYAQQGGQELRAQHQLLRRRIEWSLTDLYQRDGVPLLFRSAPVIRPLRSADRPLAFFSSQLELGAEEISVRDLTSSALLTADTLGRPLTKAELRSLVRTKQVRDWTNRLRFRVGDWPWIDVWWSDVRAGEALVNAWVPGDFFDYHEGTAGIAAERTFDLYPLADLAVRGGYRRTKARAVIPGWPDNVETSHTPFVSATVSRVFPGVAGPNKAALDVGYERSNIHPEDAPGYRRSGSICSAVFRYSIYPERTRERFTPRATDIELGAVRYTQSYNQVEVRQRDRFVGVTVREAFCSWLDLSCRYTAIEESKEHSAPEHDHAQGCVSFTPLFRLLDNENATDDAARESPLRFVNVLLPLEHTFSRSGLSEFEGSRYGLRCEAKIAHPQLRRTTVLLSAEVSRREYPRLDRSETLLNFSLKMGF